MAIIGINPVARQQQQAPREKKDLIDQILKGLQVAQGVTGIAVNVDKFMNDANNTPLKAELLQAQIAQAQAGTQATTQKTETAGRIESGVFQSEIQASQQGFAPIPEGVEGVAPLRATVAGAETQLGSVDDIRAAQALSMANLAQKEKTGRSEIEAASKKFKSESDLRIEFSGLPVTKNTELLAESYDKIIRASKLKTGASDLAVIFNYMKMLDPGSTVREGEFATAANAGSVPESIWNMYNKAKSGEKIAMTRQNFLDVSKEFMTGQLDRFKGSAEQYSRIATDQGFKPERVISKRLLELSRKLGEPPAQVPGEPPAQVPGALPTQSLETPVPGKTSTQQAPRTSIKDLPSLR